MLWTLPADVKKFLMTKEEKADEVHFTESIPVNSVRRTEKIANEHGISLS